MNRPTFLTMLTLDFTIVAYVMLAQTARAGEGSASMTASSTVAALELVHVQGR